MRGAPLRPSQARGGPSQARGARRPAPARPGGPRAPRRPPAASPPRAAILRGPDAAGRSSWHCHTSMSAMFLPRPGSGVDRRIANTAGMPIDAPARRLRHQRRKHRSTRRGRRWRRPRGIGPGGSRSRAGRSGAAGEEKAQRSTATDVDPAVFAQPAATAAAGASDEHELVEPLGGASLVHHRHEVQVLVLLARILWMLDCHATMIGHAHSEVKDEVVLKAISVAYECCPRSWCVAAPSAGSPRLTRPGDASRSATMSSRRTSAPPRT